MAEAEAPAAVEMAEAALTLPAGASNATLPAHCPALVNRLVNTTPAPAPRAAPRAAEFSAIGRSRHDLLGGRALHRRSIRPRAAPRRPSVRLAPLGLAPLASGAAADCAP